MQRQRKRMTAVSMTIAAALVVSLLGFAVAAEREVTDMGITNAVEDGVLYSPAVDLNDITVRTREGVVTLSGSVPSLLAKERAARLAETVKGVRSVVNTVEVIPHAKLSDWEIERDAEEALLYDAATESFEVDVEVQGGVATLTGWVDSFQEKALSARVVKGVRGVRGVENQLRIEYSEKRPDSEIRKDVRKALRWDALVDNGLIQVDVDGGKVILSGVVGSAAEMRRARVDAWVNGVQSVDAADLKVEPWAEEEDLRKEKYKEVTDSAVKEAVQDALLYDPRVAAFDVTPVVESGVVTLRGTVDNFKAKRAAEMDARNTVGVVSVVNRIKVQPGTPTDEELETRIMGAIEREPALEAYEIVVEVVGGTAYLYGEVDNYYEKGTADDVAARTYGVKDVENFIDVEVNEPLAYGPYTDEVYPYGRDWYDYEPEVTFRDDREIRENVQDELWWSPFVDLDQVEVIVDQGIVTLTGTVDSLGEKRAATRNAYEAGATWVRNELEVG